MADDPTFLSCKRGDLLVIVKDGEYSPEHGWIKATNEGTANTGAIATNAIQVLPTLTKPNEDTLVGRLARHCSRLVDFDRAIPPSGEVSDKVLLLN